MVIGKDEMKDNSENVKPVNSDIDYGLSLHPFVAFLMPF